LAAKDNSEPVRVMNVRHTRVGELACADEGRENLSGRGDLKRAFHNCHPRLRSDSWVTIITFRQLSHHVPGMGQ